MTGNPPSSIFSLLVHMHSACVRLLVQKLFLSGSQSCNAKIQFLPATYSLLFALLLVPSAVFRWTYFRETGGAVLDQRGQSVDRSPVVTENKPKIGRKRYR